MTSPDTGRKSESRTRTAIREVAAAPTVRPDAGLAHYFFAAMLFVLGLGSVGLVFVTVFVQHRPESLVLNLAALGIGLAFFYAGARLISPDKTDATMRALKAAFDDVSAKLPMLRGKAQ